MKGSGIEWIGEIPVEWKKNKVFRCFNIIGSGTTPKSTDDTKFEGNINWIQSGDINGGYISEAKNHISNEVLEEYSALKVYNAPFIVIAMYGASIGNIAISNIDACVNQACCVLSDSNLDFKYVFYSIKSAQNYLIRKSVGGGQPNISQDTVKSLWIVTPSISEQQKIAAHLDSECAKIDDVITKTKATIEEYKKLKQSVITEAVTKGIRANREMKDSGIEWIGEIPREWEISKTKYIASSMYKGNGITKEDVVENGDTPCVRYGEIYTKYNYSFDSCKTRTDIAKINPPQYFSYGDILFVCTGELVEEIGKNIVYLGNEKCLAGGDIIVMHHNQEPRYLNYALGCSIAQTQKSCGKSKLKVVHISASEIGNIITFLPDFEEQQEIADYLDKKCSEIDTLIAKKEQIVTELESYKKSLIYEYVTGKKGIIDEKTRNDLWNH